MIVEALLLADEVVTDADSRKTSVIGTFDRLTVTNFPAKGDLKVFVRLRATDPAGNRNVKIEITPPDLEGAAVAEMTVPFDVQRTGTWQNIRAVFSGFPVYKEGRYAVRVFDETRATMAETFFDVGFPVAGGEGS